MDTRLSFSERLDLKDGVSNAGNIQIRHVMCCIITQNQAKCFDLLLKSGSFSSMRFTMTTLVNDSSFTTHVYGCHADKHMTTEAPTIERTSMSSYIGDKSEQERARRIVEKFFKDAYNNMINSGCESLAKNIEYESELVSECSE